MSPTRWPCADFQFGLWISANNVGNINTAKSLQKKTERNLMADEKGPQLIISLLINISTKNKTFIHMKRILLRILEQLRYITISWLFWWVNAFCMLLKSQQVFFLGFSIRSYYVVVLFHKPFIFVLFVLRSRRVLLHQPVRFVRKICVYIHFFLLGGWYTLLKDNNKPSKVLWEATL